MEVGLERGLICPDEVAQQHGRQSLGQRAPKGSSSLGPYNYTALSYQ